MPTSSDLYYVASCVWYQQPLSVLVLQVARLWRIWSSSLCTLNPPRLWQIVTGGALLNQHEERQRAGNAKQQKLPLMGESLPREGERAISHLMDLIGG